MTDRRAAQRGLTLLELLVVIAILGLLTTVLGTVAIRYLGEAKSDTTALKIDNLDVALDYFRLDVGRYPTTEEGLVALLRRPVGLAEWNGPYVKEEGALADGWDRSISYTRPGPDGAPYALLSLGADGAPGGEGEDADVEG